MKKSFMHLLGKKGYVTARYRSTAMAMVQYTLPISPMYARGNMYGRTRTLKVRSYSSLNLGMENSRMEQTT